MTAVAVSHPQGFLRGLFDVAGAAVSPALCTAHLFAAPKGRTVVIGAGKAAAMAAVDTHWPMTTRIRAIGAAHPVPVRGGTPTQAIS